MMAWCGSVCKQRRSRLVHFGAACTPAIDTTGNYAASVDGR
jgi:hypothetical protein